MKFTKRWLPALLLAALATLTTLPGLAAAQVIEKSTVRHGSTEVPVEIARPEGRGPWPPVLYIHAKRGYEDVDREHIRALARDGFLVMAPDWLAANMIERWPDRHVPESEDDVEAALAALGPPPSHCTCRPRSAASISGRPMSAPSCRTTATSRTRTRPSRNSCSRWRPRCGRCGRRC